MAMFVHLTPDVNAARIRRHGIRPGSTGWDGWGRGVYVFPVLPSYTLTHQWLRELARFTTARDLVAVHVRLPDGEPVGVGHYAKRFEPVTAAEAAGRIGRLPDARGWEVFVPRRIGPREVHAFRRVPQVLGWRRVPDAHGTAPCTCVGCREYGAPKSRRLLRRRPHVFDGPGPPPRVLRARLIAAGPQGSDGELCEVLEWYEQRWRGPVDLVAPLAAHPSSRVRRGLAWAVRRWRTPGTDDILAALAADPDADVREAAGEARGLRGSA